MENKNTVLTKSDVGKYVRENPKSTYTIPDRFTTIWR